ncbi:hypothetical protein HDU82_002326 [Entophlyctis luteolus]|nr:hypothetical protein HDU82_002326 [Entophlyctis luteolus]
MDSPRTPPSAGSPLASRSKSLGSPRPPRSSSSPSNSASSDRDRDTPAVAAVPKPPASARIGDLLLSLQDFSIDDFTRGNSFDSDVSEVFTAGDMGSVHPPAPAAPTVPLSPLSRARMPTAHSISGFLDKLNPASTFAAPIYKRRFFVLTPDANLYLFKTNTNPTAIPITFLPVTKCEGFFDARENAWCLQVHGSGIVITEGGSGGDSASMTTTTTVQRSWCLKFADEHTMNMWMRQINRIAHSGSVATSSSGGEFGPGGSRIHSPPPPPFVPVQIRTGTPRRSNDGGGARTRNDSPLTPGSPQHLYQQQQQQLLAIQHYQQQLQQQTLPDPFRRSRSINSSHSGGSSVVSVPLPSGLVPQRVADYAYFNGDAHVPVLTNDGFVFRGAGIGGAGGVTNIDTSLLAGDDLSFISGATAMQGKAVMQKLSADDVRLAQKLRLENERRRTEVETAKQKTKEMDFANISKSSVDMAKKAAAAKATADKLKASLSL